MCNFSHNCSKRNLTHNSDNCNMKHWRDKREHEGSVTLREKV